MLPWWLRLWRFWIPLLLVLCLALWRDFRDGMIATFGIGLIMLVLAFFIFLYMLWWRRFNILWRYWRWCLAIAVLAIWTFGFLAFFKTHQGILHDHTLGGKWGQRVIGDQDIWGGLRLAGILLVAFLIIDYRKTLSLLKRFFWDILGIKALYHRYIEPSRFWRWLSGDKEPAPVAEAEAYLKLRRMRLTRKPGS